jgi:hypothetical protein
MYLDGLADLKTKCNTLAASELAENTEIAVMLVMKIKPKPSPKRQAIFKLLSFISLSSPQKCISNCLIRSVLQVGKHVK